MDFSAIIPTASASAETTKTSGEAVLSDALIKSPDAGAPDLEFAKILEDAGPLTEPADQKKKPEKQVPEFLTAVSFQVLPEPKSAKIDTVEAMPVDVTILPKETSSPQVSETKTDPVLKTDDLPPSLAAFLPPPQNTEKPIPAADVSNQQKLLPDSIIASGDPRQSLPTDKPSKSPPPLALEKPEIGPEISADTARGNSKPVSENTDDFRPRFPQPLQPPVKIMPIPEQVEKRAQSGFSSDIVEKPIAATPPIKNSAKPVMIDQSVSFSEDIPLSPIEFQRLYQSPGAHPKIGIAKIEPHTLNMAVKVAEQISIQVSKSTTPKIEIRLDPPELGRVTIHISPTDNNVQAVITAERPEIVDLMRRHSEILSASLERAGLGQADLKFQSGQQQQQNSGQNIQMGQSSIPEEDGVTQTSAPILFQNGDSLDIRL